MSKMDDFGDLYWDMREWKARGDADVILWRVMYFYGMVDGPSVWESPWIDLKENLL